MHNNILITGGEGFVGSHIIDKLIDSNYNVISVDNNCAINSGYLNPKARYIKADILSDEFEEVFKKYKIEYCIHLAAQTSVTTSINNPYKDAETNILGSIKVVELCKKYNCKKLIAASSAAVYGNPQYLPIDENHPTNPMSPYGLSKLTMEKYIQLSGVPYIIFRFSNAYGPRQNSSNEGGVIAIFDKAMRNNEPINIYGDGEQIRDFIYVEDIANICVKALASNIKDEVINFSTNQGESLNELFEEMSKIYGYKQEPNYMPERNGDIKDSILANKKALEIFRDIEFTNYKNGLKELMEGVYG